MFFSLKFVLENILFFDFMVLGSSVCVLFYFWFGLWRCSFLLCEEIIIFEEFGLCCCAELNNFLFFCVQLKCLERLKIF